MIIVIAHPAVAGGRTSEQSTEGRAAGGASLMAARPTRTMTSWRGERQGKRERRGAPGARPPRTRKSLTTPGNGYLGSRIDEERRKMRYVV